MERELRAERTAAGREAARARGRSSGRPKIDQEKIKQAQSLFAAEYTVAEACKVVGIGKRTFFRHKTNAAGPGSLEEGKFRTYEIFPGSGYLEVPDSDFRVVNSEIYVDQFRDLRRYGIRRPTSSPTYNEG